MATENPVFQILKSSGNQGLLAAGSRVDALAPGQLGIFNYHTGLSVDGSVVGDTRDVFIAVGKGSGGVLADIGKSAGQVIQARNTKALTVKAFVDSLPKIVEITGFKAKCDTDYSIRMEFRSQQSYGVYGMNGLLKTFNYHTACCVPNDDCSTCPTGDAVELAVGLMNAINNDPDKLATASLFANKLNFTVTAAPGSAAGTAVFTIGGQVFNVPLLTTDNTPTLAATKVVAAINTQAGSLFTASNAAGVVTIYPKASQSNYTGTTVLTSAGGTGLTIGSITSANVDVAANTTDAFKAAYPGAGLSLRITGSVGADTPFNGNIPIKWYNAKENDIIVSLTDSFECNGSVTVIQDVQYADGNGRNLALDEYVAGGWNGNPGPYRTSSITGLERGNYNNDIDPAANYNVVVLEYDQESVGGWLEYKNNLRTIIAIPCAETVTLQALIAVTDLIFTQFQPSTNDVAAMDCTNVSVNLINDTAKDGISTLA